jgi:RNA polymerase sigma factor (sigma-70 family)
MTNARDADLLEQFARDNSEPAFAVLVERHIGLVHSVALRHTANSQHAQDITQAVFIILAHKAATLNRKTILPGWLYHTARLTAANFQRAETSRVRREQEIFMQSSLQESTPNMLWPEMSPLLDEAMSHLGAHDRDALVLRYFQNKSLSEVGAAVGLEERTAQKRVTRAIEKLRKFFAQRGVTLTATAIACAVSANSVQAAPVALVKTISVIAVAKGAAATTLTLTLVKGALKFMAWTKMKTAIGVGIFLAAGIGIVAVKNNYFPSEPSYEGRKLSEWLIDIDYGQPQEKRVKAVEAVQKMGGKTLPFLLADLANKNAKDNQYSQATWAFDALGPSGKAAIPKLTKLLEQNPGYVPGALAGIGRDALPELMNALTNGSFWVRDNAAAYLANAIDSGKITPDDASAAFPVAIDNLQYDSTNAMFRDHTRWRAASLLYALKMEPDISVPALIKGMDDTNFTVAAECASALRGFGDQAKSAIPILTRASGSTNNELGRAASMSLNVIEKK